MTPAIHYWEADPATWRRVQAAAARQDVLTSEWVYQAVLERLAREADQQGSLLAD